MLTIMAVADCASASIGGVTQPAVIEEGIAWEARRRAEMQPQ
jgi:hypothetical protein